MGSEAFQPAAGAIEEESVALAPGGSGSESGGLAGYAFTGIGPVPVSVLDEGLGLVADESAPGAGAGSEESAVPG